jgi:UDP-N-acetylglucosamine--N-acetylmuramyl-(pentapeptide) pyrophosphoryl-undecaprenol N-acetylglucosamine transferase
LVHQVFVGFPQAARRLHNSSVVLTGTPVRPGFLAMDAPSCRVALGLEPARPVLLVMGGSQGASAINELLIRSLPLLLTHLPELQYIHLTGSADADQVRSAYTAHRCRAVVRPFLTEMEYALGAASVAVSRAGASSLAEFAAMQVPAILIPYPHAADNHQLHNARAWVGTHAARMLEQSQAHPERLVPLVTELVLDQNAATEMRTALRQWHTPRAAQHIAERMLTACGLPADGPREGGYWGRDCNVFAWDTPRRAGLVPHGPPRQPDHEVGPTLAGKAGS